MKLILERIEGCSVYTLGHLTIEEHGFECDTMEPAYANYTKAFQGCSYFCLPRGTYRCKVKATKYGPTTIVVAKCPGHVNVPFGYEPLDDVVTGAVLVDSQAALDRINALGRRSLLTGEDIVIEVRNETKTPSSPSPNSPPLWGEGVTGGTAKPNTPNGSPHRGGDVRRTEGVFLPIEGEMPAGQRGSWVILNECLTT